MTLRLFNTLTRRVEEFQPLNPPRVSLYTCGPTVWNYAHIGNFRTFLFEDLLRRWLEASGYQVFHVMNLTDVDDRIIKEAGRQGLPIRGLTEPFEKAFYEDRDFLRIKPADQYPRATDFIPQMIKLVARLLENGTAYRGEDGSVYFAISKFPAYGRLSQLDRRELKSGASGRVSSDEYAKEDARDFALWKAADPQDEAVGAAWDAPFGRGRPGWHLECSAMALSLLKEKWDQEVLDIHAGGVDLIFPHHEDEIAQSCAYTGRGEFARFWLHGEFLNVRGTKMSKRFGNITTPRDLQADGVDPGAIRLLLFQTHYRQKMDLTDESLAGAAEGVRRLDEFNARLMKARKPIGTLAVEEAATNLNSAFSAALDDDLDAPRAIAAVFAFVSRANQLIDEGAVPGPETGRAWERVSEVLGIVTPLRQESLAGVDAIVASDLGSTSENASLTIQAIFPPDYQLPTEAATGELSQVPPRRAEPREIHLWGVRWMLKRREAKRRKDYVEADRIRNLLASHGITLKDGKDGSTTVRYEK